MIRKKIFRENYDNLCDMINWQMQLGNAFNRALSSYFMQKRFSADECFNTLRPLRATTFLCALHDLQFISPIQTGKTSPARLKLNSTQIFIDDEHEIHDIL